MAKNALIANKSLSSLNYNYAKLCFFIFWSSLAKSPFLNCSFSQLKGKWFNKSIKILKILDSLHEIRSRAAEWKDRRGRRISLATWPPCHVLVCS